MGFLALVNDARRVRSFFAEGVKKIGRSQFSRGHAPEGLRPWMAEIDYYLTNT